MRYFITGATGYIGGRLVGQLRRAGHEVVALVRDPARARGLLEQGVSLARGDICDRDCLRAPMAGADGVFHLAAWYHVGARDTSPAERINVTGTRNVLEVMRELAIPRGVYTSTLAIFSDTKGRLVDEIYRYDGPHLSEYDRTKWVAHYVVAEPMMRQGLPLVAVLPGAVYGPGDPSSLGRMFREYLQGKLPMLPRQAALCWAHVDDIARGHVLAMEKGRPGESYILAGAPHTFEEVFAVAEKITGVRAPRILLRPGLVKALAGIMRVVGAVFPLPQTYRAETLRVVAGTTYLASSEKAKHELGFTVRSLEEGLRETLSSMMQQ